MKHLLNSLLLLLAMGFATPSFAQILSTEGMKKANKEWKSYKSKANRKKDFVYNDIKWFEQRRALNCAGCVYATGLLEGKNELKAYEYFEKIAKVNTQGDLILAYYWFHGKGVNMNIPYALSYLHKAQDTDLGRKALIIWHFYGLNGIIDYKKVIDLYNDYEQTPWDGEVEYIVGQCYLRQALTNPEEKESAFMAFSHFSKALEMGFAPAMPYVGYFYMTGKCTEKDYSRAMDYFSSSQEYLPAKYWLARMYHNGLGVASDYDKAAELYLSVISQSESTKRIDEISWGYIVDEEASLRAFFEPNKNYDQATDEVIYELQDYPIVKKNNSYILQKEDKSLADSARVYLAECYRSRIR